MNPASVFISLVRHELKLKGNWRKKNRAPVAKWWWLIYIALLILAGAFTATYFAIHHTLQLSHLWYAFTGFPYVLFFIGHGIQKQEMENDTYGWWLTLPYPRIWLIGAKWAAAGLRVLIVAVGVYAIVIAFSLIITLTLDFYTWADMKDVLLAGLDWMILLIGASPLVLALGFLTASATITAIRPVTPVLWVIFMGGGGLLYSGLNWFLAGDGSIGLPWKENEMVLSPFLWLTLAAMIASWALAYAVICLCAYLLDKKLAL